MIILFLLHLNLTFEVELDGTEVIFCHLIFVNLKMNTLLTINEI